MHGFAASRPEITSGDCSERNPRCIGRRGDSACSCVALPLMNWDKNSTARVTGRLTVAATAPDVAELRCTIRSSVEVVRDAMTTHVTVEEDALVMPNKLNVTGTAVERRSSDAGTPLATGTNRFLRRQ